MRLSRISMKLRCGVLMFTDRLQRWLGLNKKGPNSALIDLFVAGNTTLHHGLKSTTDADRRSRCHGVTIKLAFEKSA